jgi:UDP-GlcNAc3NAcA epimerase
MKVVTIVGARPQFIKAAPVSAALRPRVEEVLVHTGQHYDPEMSQAFFDELGIPEPDHHLGIGSGSHGEQTGRMLAAIEAVLVAEAPDWVLVYGDTNSTLAGALAAAKLQIPVAHVEAGLRSFDRRMPEEVNRVLVDHVASACYAPSGTAVANLAAEGVRDGVVEVGDVMVDALARVSERLPAIPALISERGIQPGGYVVITLHRAATTDSMEALTRAVDIVLGVQVPAIFPIHPRTRAALVRTGQLERLESADRVHVLPPLGYTETMGLVARARAVVTDSGGLQKEAYLLGTQCITLRQQTEWVETLEHGWNTLADLDIGRVRTALETVPWGPRGTPYGDGNAAKRIVEALSASDCASG